MAYASWSVVAGEQPSAAKWNILGTNDAFFEDFIIGTNSVHAAWSSWTPSYTNLTVGNGTNSSKYVKYGTTVLFTVSFTFGSTSSMGSNPVITSLPVTPATISTGEVVGFGTFRDATGSNYYSVLWYSGSAYQLIRTQVSGSDLVYVGISSTTPFTWTTSDNVFYRGVYQASS